MTSSREIESVEDAYNALASKAEINPSRWGQPEEEQLAALADELRRLYAEAGTPEWDQVAL